MGGFVGYSAASHAHTCVVPTIQYYGTVWYTLGGGQYRMTKMPTSYTTDDDNMTMLIFTLISKINPNVQH